MAYSPLPITYYLLPAFWEVKDGREKKFMDVDTNIIALCFGDRVCGDSGPGGSQGRP
jgi:hypothetical protein